MVIHSIQLDIDITTAVRGLSLPHSALHDPDCLVKTLLTEALGGPILRPWAIHCQTGSVASIMGYSVTPVEAVRRRLGTSLPVIRAAVQGVYGHELPEVHKGDRFRFAVR